jgi:3-oxoacyl-[acyl-carrier protein] reductase
LGYRQAFMDGLLSLHGRVALVTGAARGIGAAVVRAFVAAGARVGALDRDRDALDALCQPLGEAVLPLAADVASSAQVAEAAAHLLDRWERVDVLVNNAGLVRDATLARVTDEDFALTLDVNLKGAMACARAVVPGMVARGYGRIVSASSVVARSGNYGQTAYAASKGGIIGMTRAWARELGPKGLTANVVAPGFIDTDMLRTVPAKVIDDACARLPARRLGRPEEVANVYLFLACEAAAFVNGAVVGVDGGMRL